MLDLARGRDVHAVYLISERREAGSPQIPQPAARSANQRLTNSETSVEFTTPLWSMSVTNVPLAWSRNQALMNSPTSVEFTRPSHVKSPWHGHVATLSPQTKQCSASFWGMLR